MSAIAHLITVEEFLKLPDPKEGHNELHHGEVVTVPPPKYGHQRIQRRIALNLQKTLTNEWIVGIEMAFRPTPEYQVWVADVAVISAQRDGATPDDEYIEGPPDLVVEVLSPGNLAHEMEEKQAICLNNGCSSFWLVSPTLKQVSVTERDTIRITRTYRTGDAIPGLFGIAVDEIF